MINNSYCELRIINRNISSIFMNIKYFIKYCHIFIYKNILCYKDILNKTHTVSENIPQYFIFMYIFK